MKKLIAILITGILSAQETEFKLTPKDGFTDYVVIQKDGQTAAQLYQKTLDWANRTYSNPEKAIIGKIENEYIRILGAKPNFLCVHAIGIPTCQDSRYEIEISFKDGKYKFDVTKLELYMAPSQLTSGGWSETPMDFAGIYNKKGEIKPAFRDYPTALPAYFNAVNRSLSGYISGTELKNDW